MPTYEYECKKCMHRFEEFQSITADPLSKCPKCSGSVRRLIGGGVGIIFKGSGFYSTDNKKPSANSGTSGSDTNGADQKSGDSAKDSSSTKDSSSSKDGGSSSSNGKGSQSKETSTRKSS